MFLRAIRLFGLASAVAAVSTAHAETQLCENGVVTAHSPQQNHLPLMCAAADRALTVFDQCALTPPTAIDIFVSDLSDQSCLGLFHCGEARIEVIAPDIIDTKRSDIGLFNPLTSERLFESVIVHEIAHAAVDLTPCPLASCVATSEYFAYTVQLLDLTEDERETVMASASAASALPADPVKHDEINAFLLYMAPDLFVDKVWRHVTGRGDPCLQLRRIQDGSLIFDRFHP